MKFIEVRYPLWGWPHNYGKMLMRIDHILYLEKDYINIINATKRQAFQYNEDVKEELIKLMEESSNFKNILIDVNCVERNNYYECIKGKPITIPLNNIVMITPEDNSEDMLGDCLGYHYASTTNWNSIIEYYGSYEEIKEKLIKAGAAILDGSDIKSEII